MTTCEGFPVTRAHVRVGTSSNELHSEFMHSGAERQTRGCEISCTCGLFNKKALIAATMRLSMAGRVRARGECGVLMTMSVSGYEDAKKAMPESGDCHLRFRWTSKWLLGVEIS